MKRIAVFCVTYHSDRELEQYLTSLRRAQEYAGDKVGLDIFVGRNTDEDNPGYFGAVRRLMTGVEVKNYDYVIVSNVDLTVEVDFLTKLADYDCAGDTGWGIVVGIVVIIVVGIVVGIVVFFIFLF